MPTGATGANLYLTQPNGATGTETLYMSNVQIASGAGVAGLGLTEPLGGTLFAQLQNAVGRSLQAVAGVAATPTAVVVDVGANNR